MLCVAVINILMCLFVCATHICRRLTCDHEGVRPDVVTLGKALSGGTMAVSIAESIPVRVCITV